MKTYYVYWSKLKSHTDPYSQGYIGVTCQPKIRFNTHRFFSNAYSKKVREMYEKHGEDVELYILYEGTQDQAYFEEYYYRPLPKIGWNIQKGGMIPPDCTGNKHSDTSKSLISKANTGKNLGKPSPFKGLTNRYNEQTRKLIGSYHKGKTISEEHKKAITEKNSGINNPKSETVYMYHIDNPTKIHTFVNYREASENTNIPYSSLREQGRLRLGKPNKHGWIITQVGDRVASVIN